MNKIRKKLKKNKYNILVLVVIFFILAGAFSFVRSKIEDINLSKYGNDIIIIKGNGDEIESYSIKELKKLGSDKTEVYINNGLEKVEIEGISLEKLIGDLDYNLREKPIISIEDTNGNLERYPMSIALEVDRIYLVYKVEGKPLAEYNKDYGTLAIVDTTSKSTSSWLTNVKTINIQ